MASAPSNSTGLIVVGVDGSVSSIDALRWALSHAATTGMRLHVITCWEALDSYTLDEADIADSVFENQARLRLQDSLDRVLDQKSQVVQLTTSVERGYAAKVLINASRDADLLVVGSRGHGGFVGMLLGSVAQHCVPHSLCPVVVVRHQNPA